MGKEFRAKRAPVVPTLFIYFGIIAVAAFAFSVLGNAGGIEAWGLGATFATCLNILAKLGQHAVNVLAR